MVHEDTLRDVIDSGSTVLGSLLKEAVIHRQQLEQIQTEKELELELARERAKGTNGHGTGETAADRAAAQAVGAGAGDEDIREAFADLRQREECGICQQLLDGIEQADRRTQVRALTEYGKLQRALETGATEGEIRELIEDSDMLVDLLEQQLTA